MMWHNFKSSSGDNPGPRRSWQRPPSSTARAQDESSGGTMPTMGPRGPPRRAPGMAPGRAGNARGHHRAPPRRPLMGEGCRQAERHRAPHPHRRAAGRARAVRGTSRATGRTTDGLCSNNAVSLQLGDQFGLAASTLAAVAGTAKQLVVAYVIGATLYARDHVVNLHVA